MKSLFALRFSILAGNILLYVGMSYQYPAGIVTYNADLALAFALLPIIKCGLDVSLADQTVSTHTYSYVSAAIMVLLTILHFYFDFKSFLEILVLILSMQVFGAHFRRFDKPAFAILVPSLWQPVTYLGLIAEFEEVLILSVLFYFTLSFSVLISLKCAHNLKINFRAMPSQLVGFEVLAQFPRAMVIILITNTISVQVINEFDLFCYNVLIRAITLIQVPQDVLNIKFLSLRTISEQNSFMRIYRFSALFVLFFLAFNILILLILSASGKLLVLTSLAYLLVVIKYFYGPILIFLNRSRDHIYKTSKLYLFFIPLLLLSDKLNFQSSCACLLLGSLCDYYFRRIIYKRYMRN